MRSLKPLQVRCVRLDEGCEHLQAELKRTSHPLIAGENADAFGLLSDGHTFIVGELDVKRSHGLFIQRVHDHTVQLDRDVTQMRRAVGDQIDFSSEILSDRADGSGNPDSYLSALVFAGSA